MANSKRKRRAVDAAIKQANKPRVLHVQGLRGSNASGIHEDRRTRRSRTRGAKNAKAIDEFS